MRFRFNYRIGLHDRANPPGRHEAVSEIVREWFKRIGVEYGIGALGGMRNIYGDATGPTEVNLRTVREQFASWLLNVPLNASVKLGRLKPVEVARLMDNDWELEFELNNLTEADRAAAAAYYLSLSERITVPAARPADTTPP